MIPPIRNRPVPLTSWETELARWQAGYAIGARLDGLRWFFGNLGLNPAALDGKERTAAFKLATSQFLQYLQVVQVVVGIQARDRGEDTPDLLERVRRFLSLQVYGATPFEVGGTYTVRVVGDINVEFQVDAFTGPERFIDLEDLFTAFGFHYLCIRARKPLSKKQADALVEQVRNDLTFDGDEFELEWKIGGGRLGVLEISVRERETKSEEEVVVATAERSNDPEAKAAKRRAGPSRRPTR